MLSSAYDTLRRVLVIATIYIAMCVQINGQHNSWEHLRKLYNRKQSTSGLNLLQKLTFEQVNLNSYSRMRVNLAVQVSICST